MKIKKRTTGKREYSFLFLILKFVAGIISYDLKTQSGKADEAVAYEVKPTRPLPSCW